MSLLTCVNMWFYTSIVSFMFVNSELINSEILEKLHDIESRLSAIDVLETENEKLKSRMSKYKTYQKTIENMKNEYNEVIGGMLNKIKHQELIISELHHICVANLTRFNKDTSGPDAKKKEDKSVFSSGNQPNVNLEKRLSLTPGRDISTVAFAAYLTKTIDNAAIGHIIPFDHLYMNEGNGYNGSDGIFISPKTGLYLFTYNIYLVGTNKRAGVTLKVNGNSFMWSFEVTDGTLVRSNAADTTVLRLNAGDHVWLAFTVTGSHAYGGAESNFSGVLIAE